MKKNKAHQEKSPVYLRLVVHCARCGWNFKPDQLEGCNLYNPAKEKPFLWFCKECSRELKNILLKVKDVDIDSFIHEKLSERKRRDKERDEI